ncbi:DUF4876 domain-containing protein [Filimonas effusa]|nr:DUF4876 domain-containing protein [Filimonas effusa]
MQRLKLWIIAAAVLTLGACKKDLGPDVAPVTFNGQIVLDASIAGPAFPLDKVKVIITNTANNLKNETTADAQGKISLSNISPGRYEIQATLTLTATEYASITGNYASSEVVFNAVEQIDITAQSGTVTVTLIYGQLAKEWIIKQIYYAGSHTSNGAMFRDQFLELYNNSDHDLYADSLYFGQVYGINTARESQDMTKPYFLPTGSFDWTKSIGMSDTRANDNYVYCRSVFRIPGNGKTYKVAPGASIIIAQNAQNHKAPYVGATGESVTVKDPSLTVDLSNADFEVYLGNYPGNNQLASDVDNPAVPNIETILRGSGRDLILDNLGREAIVIFKWPGGAPAQWPTFPSPEETTVTTATSKYIQVPATYLEDAVELQQTPVARRTAKRIPAISDAGYTYVPGGSYSSQSSIRKTKSVVNGRRILQDTNNSTNDFGSLTKADPSKTAFAD